MSEQRETDAPQAVPEPTRSRGQHLRNVLKLVALVVVVAFIVWYVVQNWNDVVPVLATLTWWQIVVALICASGGVVASMLSWRAVLSGMGSHLGFRPAARVFFLGQLGKYVPGSIWPIVAQAELAKEYGTPRARGAVALIVQMIVSVVVGTLFAAVCLVASSPAAVTEYWWLVVLAVIGIVCVIPPVFRRIMRIICKVIRRPADELDGLTFGDLLKASGWSLAMWALFGVHMVVLSLAAAPLSMQLVLTAAGGYALAWLVGFVIIFLPAGAGAREAALALALAPVMGGPAAVGLALVSRFVMLAIDLIFAGAAVLAEKARQRRAA
ncbi:lysylphosphatidylglycerol synthase domain-containing protein [Humibacter sp. RRB41]|uniref:lysylphosphatidylglycerol synthase domain-containing protein n=1 Tax=Humibacter sp. RRB41 TaxID=2919946 RepID=UPI001FAA47F2|nr:lysylphosphatidylglycerol synthase domain-containing protein [Humibacter sp. RRB41]